MNENEVTAIRILTNGQPVLENDISVAALQMALRALTEYIGRLTISAPNQSPPDVNEPVIVSQGAGLNTQ